jgi:hypothetical protein
LHVDSEAGVAALLIAMLVSGAVACGAVGAFAITGRRPVELAGALCWIVPWVLGATNLVWLAGYLLGLQEPGAPPPSDVGARGVGFAAIGGCSIAWSAVRRVPRTRSSIAWLVIYGLVAIVWMIATAEMLQTIVLISKRGPEELDDWRLIVGISYAGARVALAVLLWRSVTEPIPRARVHAG